MSRSPWLWWDRVADAWSRLGSRGRALVVAVPAWGVLVAVAASTFGGGSVPAAREVSGLPAPVPPPLAGTTSALEQRAGGMVLSARGEDGRWTEVRTVSPRRLFGQLATLTATSPDRRTVAMVEADDPLLANATISLVDVESGRAVPVTTIAEGLYPATPVWSPDASRIGLVRKGANGGLDLWTLHLATGELVRVPAAAEIPPTAFYGGARAPLAWSEDGGSLSYAVPDRDRERVVRHDVAIADGTTRTESVADLPPADPCSVPVFSQNDPRWANRTMRDLGDTIGVAGCALTAAAMVLNAHGGDTDPGALNDCLGAAAAPLLWAVAAGDGCDGPGAAEFEEYAPFSWDRLGGQMAQGRPAILGFAGGPTGSHYVVVTAGFGSDGANYTLNDPWDGTTWKTIDDYAETGYVPTWLVIFRGGAGCPSRAMAPAGGAPSPPLLPGPVAPIGVEGTWRWRAAIEEVAAEVGADPDAIQALVALKSGGNPNAVGPPAPGGARAMGLFGVDTDHAGWDAVADRLGRPPTDAERLDPEDNLRVGALALKARHDRGDRWADWLTAAVGALGGAAPDGRITGITDAYGVAGWTHYDRVRANVEAIRERLRAEGRLAGGGGPPNPASDARRPSSSPAAGSIATIFGGASYAVSQNFGYTGFTPGPGAYDYSREYGLRAGDHAGVDLGVAFGTPVYAPVGARITFAGPWQYFAPQNVQLTMSDGTVVVFGHMSRVSVRVGGTVSPNQPLGDSGTAGTGPHLHLEVRVPDPTTGSGFRAVDPLLFFSGAGSGVTGGAIPGGWPSATAIDGRIAQSEAANGRSTALHGAGETFLALGSRYAVNPGFVAAMLQKESQLGTDGSALPTVAHNYGGITGSGACGKHWIDFAEHNDRYFAKYCSPQEGLEANFAIFTQPQYTRTDGTIAAILNVYSPGFENDTGAMLATIAAVGQQLGITLAPNTNIYTGATTGPIAPPSPMPVPAPVVDPVTPVAMPSSPVAGGSPVVALPGTTVTAAVLADMGASPIAGDGVVDATPRSVPSERLPVLILDTLEDGGAYREAVVWTTPDLVFPLDPGAVVQSSVPDGTVFTEEGRYTVVTTVISPQIPGNVASFTHTFVIDRTPPETTAEVVGVRYAPGAAIAPASRDAAGLQSDAAQAAPGDQVGVGDDAIVYDGEAVVTLRATDAWTPIKAIVYRIDGGEWRYYTTNGIAHALSLRQPGCQSLEFAARDAAGNAEPGHALTVCVHVDETTLAVPTATPTWTASPTASPLPTAIAAPSPSPGVDPTATAPVSPTPTTALSQTPSATATTAIATPSATSIGIATPGASPVATPPPDGTPAPDGSPPVGTPSVGTPPVGTPATDGTPPNGTTVQDGTPPVGTPPVGTPAPDRTPPDGTPSNGTPPSAGSPTATTAPPPSAATPSDRTPTDGTPTAPTGIATPPTLKPIPRRPPATPAPSLEILPTAALVGGTLVIELRDPADQSLAGACFAVSASDGATLGPVCDGEDGADDGQTTIANVPPGNATVSETTAPAGYSAATPKQIPVLGGIPIGVVFENAPGSGSVLVRTEAAGTGALVGGACFQILASDGTGNDPVCDNAAADTDPAEGLVGIAPVPAGPATVRETTPPPGYDPGADQSVPVESGQQAVVILGHERQRGDLHITNLDQNDQPLSGACFRLTAATGEPIGPVCDNGDGDANAEQGKIDILAVPSGDVTLIEETVPEGYAAEGDTLERVVPVVPNQPNPVMVGHVAAVELRVIAVDAVSEDRLPGVELVVVDPNLREIVPPQVTNADGVADFRVPPGVWFVHETAAPTGYAPAKDQRVDVTGEPVMVSVPHQPLLATLVVLTVDDADEPLPGACYELRPTFAGRIGRAVATGCDSDDDRDDGRTTVDPPVPPGRYRLVQSTPAEDHDAAQELPIGLESGENRRTVVSTPIQTGTVQVSTTDVFGTEIDGACYGLRAGTAGVPEATVVPATATVEPSAVPGRPTAGIGDGAPSDEVVAADGDAFLVGPVCDAADGVLDGLTTLEDVPVGALVVVPSNTPTTYQVAAEQAIEVEADETTLVAVTLVPAVVIANGDTSEASPVPGTGPVAARVPVGSVTVVAISSEGIGLMGAEFALIGPSGEELGRAVTGADGLASFPTVPIQQGEFCVVETVAPAGFAGVGARDPAQCFALDPGANAEVVFLNEAVAGR
ncbi:MAG: hypothetical protein AVDCRST_MAG73-467 [uncultured Thermomicrobiales bacterium]|uniref:Peptidase M23 domain-containing protein n=1 Tax=uncultured Thermomicrobiales bacterium TaxID=1645740 RepID=A0A6J4TLI6_9BACT|nr:MAG: hypothetical protein AVDCRST_MAG73-467 [uncultured Thermomicrobiales bacterium]